MRTVLSVTGTRSDWGIMQPVYEAVHGAGMKQHCLMTSMLLLPQFAEDKQRVVDNFPGQIHEVPMQDERSTNDSMVQALGNAITRMTPYILSIKPDIVLLQGDRGEMLAAALVALHLNIPVVHMSGGDRSGTVDDAIRHAISSVAHIHLTTCEPSSQELLRRGESAGRILAAGEPGLDTVLQTEFLSRSDLWDDLGIPQERDVILVAQHPGTTEFGRASAQMQATLEVCCATAKEQNLVVLVTAANTDAGGDAMNDVIKQFAARNEVYFIPSLGARRFLSMLRYARVLVGNSSSGIWEAPSFGLATVNIGTRQHGRLRTSNVLDVPEYTNEAIQAALQRALHDEAFKEAVRNSVNPYGDGHSAQRTAKILEGLDLQDPTLVAKWLDKGRDFLEFAR